MKKFIGYCLRCRAEQGIIFMNAEVCLVKERGYFRHLNHIKCYLLIDIFQLQLEWVLKYTFELSRLIIERLNGDGLLIKNWFS